MFSFEPELNAPSSMKIEIFKMAVPEATCCATETGQAHIPVCTGALQSSWIVPTKLPLMFVGDPTLICVSHEIITWKSSLCPVATVFSLIWCSEGAFTFPVWSV